MLQLWEHHQVGKEVRALPLQASRNPLGWGSQHLMTLSQHLWTKMCPCPSELLRAAEQSLHLSSPLLPPTTSPLPVSLLQQRRREVSLHYHLLLHSVCRHWAVLNSRCVCVCVRAGVCVACCATHNWCFMTFGSLQLLAAIQLFLQIGKHC